MRNTHAAMLMWVIVWAACCYLLVDNAIHIANAVFVVNIVAMRAGVDMEVVFFAAYIMSIVLFLSANFAAWQ